MRPMEVPAITFRLIAQRRRTPPASGVASPAPPPPPSAEPIDCSPPRNVGFGALQACRGDVCVMVPRVIPESRQRISGTPGRQAPRRHRGPGSRIRPDAPRPVIDRHHVFPFRREGTGTSAPTWLRFSPREVAGLPRRNRSRFLPHVAPTSSGLAPPRPHIFARPTALTWDQAFSAPRRGPPRRNWRSMPAPAR